MAVFKKLFALGTIILLNIFLVDVSSAFLLYYKPSFKGMIIDAETKQPVEGVVVVVRYYKQVISPFKWYSELFDVRESMTDNDGIFRIPSYLSITNPLNSYVGFIFFKPGYGHDYRPINFTSQVIMYNNGEERFFSENFGKIGKLELNKGPEKLPLPGWHEVTFGIIQMDRLKTMEERVRAERLITSTPNELRRKTPIYNKICEMEHDYLYPKKEERPFRRLRILESQPKPQSVGPPPAATGTSIPNE